MDTNSFTPILLNGQNGYKDIDVEVLFRTRPAEPDYDELDHGSAAEQVPSIQPCGAFAYPQYSVSSSRQTPVSR